MAESFVPFVMKKHLKPSARVAAVIETCEGRTLFSTTPVFGQCPPPIIAKVYPDQHKSTPPAAPAVTVPPPVSNPLPPAEPVQPVLAEAPKYFKGRAARRDCSICLSWKNTNPDAKTIVIEASTDGGQSFTTIAMLEKDQRKFAAQNLNRHKTYTFRIYTLDATGTASKSCDITVQWCPTK